ncbi:MAG: CoA ester lyase [Microcella sp.]|uniref:HpcH/HpaI aldolase/citrate lyase family protein n=1 Tax=Microcella sp. TaxID=1913979 RepID=UPI0024CD09A7|nr:CoA ester lyase [Microcella sp.]UYN84666.1 MAG: CoA ester lyase [Microcella sp.]
MTVVIGPALLFCPADRADRFDKAAARADTVILDLEDAVAPADREAARRALIETPLDPATTVVRVNPRGTADHELDLAALAQTDYRTIMLAKAVDVSGLDGFSVIALCETAHGVLACEALAAQPHVVALMWGAEDLVASLGGTSSRHDDARYRDVAVHARARVLLAAGAHGIAAIDAVHLDIADLEGLAAEARDAAAQGFTATACIHPSQVETVREAYRPSTADVERARAIIDAAERAAGVFVFDGQMIDEPLLRHARQVLLRARTASS